jgi:type VI secretion system protein ImpG
MTDHAAPPVSLPADEFFARYVSINSFTETTVSTLERGELIRWPAKTGLRQVV